MRRQYQIATHFQKSQETLDPLGVNKHFTVLDQGNAYQQGCIVFQLTSHSLSLDLLVGKNTMVTISFVWKAYTAVSAFIVYKA